MAQQTISFGEPPLGIGGDTRKTAFVKCNENFTELYSSIRSALQTYYTSNNTTIYKDVLSHYQAGASTIGALVIRLPKAKFNTNTMLSFTIKGYSYSSNNGMWELRVGGYNYSTGWLQYSANLAGPAPFDKVRLAWGADHNAIIIGDVDTVWSYPQTHIRELLAGYSNHASGWDTGYVIGYLTDLAEFTNIVTPILYGQYRVKAAETLLTGRSLTVGRTAKSFDGSSDVSWTADEVLPTGTNGQVLKHNGTSWVAGTDNNTTYSAMSATEANTGTATSGRVITAAVLKGAIQTHAPVQTSVTGNAGSATKLNSVGRVTALTGTETPPAGLRLGQVYDNGYPTPYGNVLQVGGSGHGELLIGWSGTNGGLAPAYMRSKRDTPSAPWSAWREIVFKDAFASMPTFSTSGAGLVPARSGATTTKYLREDGTWTVPPNTNTTYAAMTAAEASAGTGTTARLITPATLKSAVVSHAPVGGQFLGTAANKAIAYNAQTIAENITIPATYNGLSAGPITINDGYTVTIADGATWTIV